jgi:hypothetical protein
VNAGAAVDVRRIFVGENGNAHRSALFRDVVSVSRNAFVCHSVCSASRFVRCAESQPAHH